MNRGRNEKNDRTDGGHGSHKKINMGEKTTGTGQPGEVVRLEEDGFVVATGNSVAIKVTDLQPAGKKRMDGATFMRGAGQKLRVGDRLGGTHERT